jgi:hypothetical protein
MRVKSGEKLWYKRHPIIDGTDHVGWRNGTIDEHVTFLHYEHPQNAPSAADFVDADGNLMEYEDVLEAWDRDVERERKERPDLYDKPRRRRGGRPARKRPSVSADKTERVEPKAPAKEKAAADPEPEPDAPAEDESIDPFAGQ